MKIGQIKYLNGNTYSWEATNPWVEIKIKTVPGTQIFLTDENSSTSNATAITIGDTGIYEINEDQGIEIARLALNEKSAEIIAKNDDYYFIATYKEK